MKNPRSIADYADAPGVHLLGREDAWMAYSVSGGKDSSAAIAATMPLLDSIGHPRERRFLLHADLGRSEWRSTHSHVEDLARHFGLPLHVVKHTTHDMVSRWERRGELGRERWAKGETVNLVGPWSSAGTRFCTSEMKIHVMSRFKRVYAEPVVSVMGIRRDESIGRSRAAFEAIDTGMKRYGRDDCMTWNPIADWSSEDVFAIHERQSIPLHEAYGLGSTRLSCNFCVLASINDLSIAAEHAGNHETHRELVRMECRFAFSFQPSRWLGDVRADLLDARMRADLATAKDVAAHRRAAEADYPEEYRKRRYGLLMPRDWDRIARIRSDLAPVLGIPDAVADPRSALGLG